MLSAPPRYKTVHKITITVLYGLFKSVKILDSDCLALLAVVYRD
jgi:hypothetical protein